MKTFDFLEEPIDEAFASINKQQEAVLMQRIRERVGIDVDLYLEIRRMFPRIAGRIDYKGNHQYFWNDGTTDGLLLVTFAILYETDFKNGSFSISLKYE